MSQFRFGAMTLDDMALMERALSYTKSGSLRYLEIGCYAGETVRGVSTWCKVNNIKPELTAMDVKNNLTQPLPEGTHYVLNDSAIKPPWCQEFDVVFIDGCHCVYHCAMDILNYAPMVCLGGRLLIHDTSPHLQGTQPQHWVHPPREPFCLHVLDAIEAVDFPWQDWKFVDESCDTASDIGGMRLYIREL